MEQLDKRSEQLSGIAVDVGLRINADGSPREFTVPDRLYQESGASPAGWFKRSVAHVAAVLRGRPVDVVGRAIQSAGMQSSGGRGGLSGSKDDLPSQLIDDESFMDVQRHIAAQSVQLIQDHWTARLSVHLQTRLDLFFHVLPWKSFVIS